MVTQKNDQINRKLFHTPIKSTCRSGIFNYSSNKKSSIKKHDINEIKSNFKSINTIVSSEIISLENDLNTYKKTLDRIIIKEGNLKNSIDELSSILDNYEKELKII